MDLNSLLWMRIQYFGIFEESVDRTSGLPLIYKLKFSAIIPVL
jgi:hypothetical protein